MGPGYGTVRSKTSSSRDDSLQNHFSNGTVHPGTVRSICKKLNKSILKKWKSFLMNCEHHSRDEPFPGIFFVLFFLDKKVCLFVFQKCVGRFTQGTVRSNLKKMQVNASNDRF